MPQMHLCEENQSKCSCLRPCLLTAVDVATSLDGTLPMAPLLRPALPSQDAVDGGRNDWPEDSDSTARSEI